MFHPIVILATLLIGLFPPGAAQEAPLRLQTLPPLRFLETPAAGCRVVATTVHTEAQGGRLVSVHTFQTRSDTADRSERRYSGDHGQTWGAPEEVVTERKVAAGTWRRYERRAYLDPASGVLITFVLQGVLPGDDPLEGMRHWTLRTVLSRDGGRSVLREDAVVQAGEPAPGEAPYDEGHPLPGVWIGRNSVMIGDASCRPITRQDGVILQPVQITPLGPDGVAHNPGGGYTFHDAAVLIGRWNAEGGLDWTLSERIPGDPERSTRGWIEPTLAELDDGRLMMLLRGSNDVRPSLPGHRWLCVSGDGGQTWSRPEPWRDSQGRALHSPSSCSQLLAHSSGRLLWIGNLCQDNPRGNHPRHPLVIGEVDRASLRLRQNTLCTIDRWREGDSPRLQISNFLAREDRRNGQVLVHCSPIGRPHAHWPPRPDRNGVDWTADAWLYRVEVSVPGAPDRDR